MIIGPRTLPILQITICLKITRNLQSEVLFVRLTSATNLYFQCSLDDGAASQLLRY